MIPHLSDTDTPQCRELSRALQELHLAAAEHQRRIEASRRPSLWGSMKHGARAITRLFGWAE